MLDLLQTASGREPQTLADLSGRNDSRERKFRRAMDDFGAVKFFNVTGDGWLADAFGHDDLVFTLHEEEPQIPDRRVPLQRAAKIYQLRADLKPIILDMLAAYLADKHDVPRFNRHQIAALGIQDNPQSLADAINARIEPHLTTEERADRDKRLGKALAEYRQWERDLDDPTVASAQPNGEKSLTEQTVARTLATVGNETTWNKVELAAAMPRARIRRNLHKLGKTTDVRRVAGPVATEATGLPPQEYDQERAAYPDQGVSLETGETFNLRSPVGRSMAYEALRQGESVRVDYAAGITIRDMTADEIAKRDAPKEPKPRAYARNTRTDSRVRALGPDTVRIVRLLNWAETVCKLPGDSTLTSVQRVYRLAGREPMFATLSQPDVDDRAAFEPLPIGAVLVGIEDTAPIVQPEPLDPSDRWAALKNSTQDETIDRILSTFPTK